MTRQGLTAVELPGGKSAPQATFTTEQPVTGNHGLLIHDDFVRLENEAYDLLDENIKFRAAISPYNEKALQFDDLVLKFDELAGAKGGFDNVTLPEMPGFGEPVVGRPKTLADRLDEADRELRRARDMYGVLAVYASEARFRTDSRYTGKCAPDNPLSEPPLWDRCDFGARMRQAVREVANLRMIFGQQFTIDALGLNFSAELIGTDTFVRREVAKLKSAVGQFEIAQQAVQEGLSIDLGSGCYISDFYQQSEWRLLSVAAEGKVRAQYHLGVRLSYLDVDPNNDPNSVAEAAAKADDTLKDSATGQYLVLIGTAGERTAQASQRRCSARGGTSPGGELVSAAVAGIRETASQAKALRSGLNVMGYDPRLTLAVPLNDTFTGPPENLTIKGLLTLATTSANAAVELQADDNLAQRVYEQNAQLAMQAIESTVVQHLNQLRGMTGCTASDTDTDALIACARTTAERLRRCRMLPEHLNDPKVAAGGIEHFNACLDAVEERDSRGRLIRNGKSQLTDARRGYLQAQVDVLAAKHALDNIDARVTDEQRTNVLVFSEIFNTANEVTLLQALAEIASSVSISSGKDGVSVTTTPGSPVAAVLRSEAGFRQAMTQATISSARSEQTVRNLLLEKSEGLINLWAAKVKSDAALSVFEQMASQVERDVVDTRRARAYVVQGPINDPSYRLIRDSLRLRLASQVQYAGRQTYLAARRLEYEYGIRLFATACPDRSTPQDPVLFRMSDIYRARTGQDLLSVISCLEQINQGRLSLSTRSAPYDVSVARHVLGLTHEELGEPSDAAARQKRIARFREWVGKNVVTTRGSDGRDTQHLQFGFSTSLAGNGVIAQTLRRSYDRIWLHKLVQINMDIETSQGGDHQWVNATLTLRGVTHLRNDNGCIFEYRLIDPRAFYLWDYTGKQEETQAPLRARTGLNDKGLPAVAFRGYPVSAADWNVDIDLGSADSIQVDLRPELLEDIWLRFETVEAGTLSGLAPDPSRCVRVDF